MAKILWSVLFSGALFVGAILCIQWGWRLGKRHLAKLGSDDSSGLGAVEGAVFALLGLLIAFTFTGAANRFDERRHLIVEHVDAIGTAWSLLDLLDESPRAELHELFRQFVDEQIQISHDLELAPVLERDLERSRKTQDRIWVAAIAAAENSPSQPVAQVILPAINRMFDVAESRIMASHLHPPAAIFIFLVLLVFVSALMAGFGMSRAAQLSRLHVAGFAFVVSVAVYLTLDLEYPRLGLMRVDDFDSAMLELRQSMQESAGESR